MPDTLTLGLAQLNPTVGDIAGNLAKLRRTREASTGRCELLVCGELVMIGYPPEDLVLRPSVLAATKQAIEDLAADTTSGPAILVTAPLAQDGCVYNAVLLLAEGRIAAIRYKHELPNYGVFDEKRVFVPGPLPDPIDFHGVRLDREVKRLNS